MNYQDQLNNIKNTNQKNKEEKITLLERKRQQEEKQKEINLKLKELEIIPENLQDELQNSEIEIQELLEKSEGVLK